MPGARAGDKSRSRRRTGPPVAPTAGPEVPARPNRLRNSRWPAILPSAPTGPVVGSATGVGRLVTRGPGRGAAQEPVDLVAVDRLALHQQLCQFLQRLPVLAQDAERPLLGLAQQPGDLLVDDPLGGLGVGPAADLLGAQVHRAV